MLLAAQAAHAGAWSLPEGEALVISTTDYTVAGDGFGSDEALNFEKTEQRLYAERGIGGRWTLVGQASFQDVLFSGLDGKSRYIGPGSVRAGARRELTRDGPERWAVQADLGYQRGGEFVTDGELIYEDVTTNLRALYGRGWARGFLDVQAGYELRFGEAPDTWQGDVSAGWDVTQRVSLLGGAFARATGGARIGVDEIAESRSLKLKGSVLYHRRRTSFEFGVISTVAGRNHVRDGGVTVAVWRRFGGADKTGSAAGRVRRVG